MPPDLFFLPHSIFAQTSKEAFMFAFQALWSNNKVGISVGYLHAPDRSLISRKSSVAPDKKLVGPTMMSTPLVNP